VPASDLSVPEPLPRLTAALQARRKVRILALGGSPMSMRASAKGQQSQFETILEDTFKGLDLEILNRGVSGETAAVTAERLKLQVATEKPDLVLWQIGTSDAMARIPVQDFTATVEQALRWLKQHKVDVVLVGLQYTLNSANDPYYTEMRTALRKAAEAEGVLLLKRYEAVQAILKARNEGLVSTDGLQANDIGYRCMAEHLARAVMLSTFYRHKLDAAPRN
jgi:lysophospholipase L1-like esterase